MEFYLIEPFGEYREDLRMGILASTIANVNRSKKTKVFKPEDFIPDFKPKKKQTWQEQLKIVEVLNVAFGGVDKRKH